jgi:CRP-like cAMP-binding protein
MTILFGRTPHHEEQMEENVNDAPGSSNLLQFLEDKPRVSKAVQRWIITTDSQDGEVAGNVSNGSWHFRSLFVIEATMVNISFIFFLLFFWVINRQTHLRPTKGTTIIRKSEEDRTITDDSSFDEDDGGEETETQRPRNRNRLSSMEQFLSYGIEQDDDDGGESTSVAEDPEEELKNFPWSRQMRDLVRIAKTFGYLNQQALTICAKSAEYVNFQDGGTIFEADSYDGTFFAVVSGSVELTFCDFEAPDDFLPNADLSGETRQPFKMIVGPDKPITSFLSFFWGMINVFPENHDSTKSIKHPFRVSARAIADNTEVIRIGPDCFARILKEFPVDVFRITNTVLNRLQRITIQTLVTTLGLRRDLLSPPRPVQQYEKDLVASDTWKVFQDAMTKEDFCDETDLIEQAAQLIRMRLGITAEIDSESIALLRDSSELIVFDGAHTLIEPGSKHHSCYLLLQGNMEVGIIVPNGPNEMSFHRHQMIYPGALLGEHECFTGDVSLMVVRSVPCEDSVNCVLLKISKNVYNTLIVRYPKAMARALDMLLHQVSPAVFLLQWTAEWLNVKAAGDVAKKGTKCDSLYVVLNGRLRARKRDTTNQKTPEEYGRGSVVGEIGILTGASWPFDVYAIRHSEIARVPVETLLTIIHAFPKAGLNFARSVALHIQNTANAVPRSLHPTVNPGQQMMLSYGLNLATIAVVPMDSTGIDLDKFCSTLTNGFQRIAPSKLVTKDSIRDSLGEKSYRNHNSAMHELRMVRMLADIEENNRLVVYQADPKYTWWTRLCIQQADCILLVVNSGRAPEGKRVEQSLATAYESMDVRIDLVVVGDNHQIMPYESGEEDDEDFDLEQDDEMNVSDQLNNWSEQRKWISGHHLVRSPIGRHKQDFHRLCRRVTGRAVGLVLGSGGARGLAHLGVIRALKEAGVTIDLVGGTSQGVSVSVLTMVKSYKFLTQ